MSHLKQPTRLMLGRTMNSKTCYTRDHTKKPNERSNAKLSRRVAVGSNAGLEALSRFFEVKPLDDEKKAPRHNRDVGNVKYAGA